MNLSIIVEGEIYTTPLNPFLSALQTVSAKLSYKIYEPCLVWDVPLVFVPYLPGVVRRQLCSALDFPKYQPKEGSLVHHFENTLMNLDSAAVQDDMDPEIELAGQRA